MSDEVCYMYVEKWLMILQARVFHRRFFARGPEATPTTDIAPTLLAPPIHTPLTSEEHAVVQVQLGERHVLEDLDVA